jgi:hypothetical protein
MNIDLGGFPKERRCSGVPNGVFVFVEAGDAVDLARSFSSCQEGASSNLFIFSPGQILLLTTGNFVKEVVLFQANPGIF